MKLTWIGHSCFRIEKDGYILIIDPYTDGSVPGLNPVAETADQVLCSHEHGDHNGRNAVHLREEHPAENPFTVEVIHTFHDEVQGAKRGKNQIFILSDGTNRVAHLGDLGCDPEEDQLEKLKGLDAVMVPVGGYYTIDGAQAAKLIKQLNPRIVIPMHFRNDQAGFGFAEISEVSDFTEKMEAVAELTTSEIETEYDLPAQVVVLQPARKK